MDRPIRNGCGRRQGDRMNDRVTISTLQLFEMFPDEETARKYLESRLWPNGARCPVCKQGERVATRKDGYYRCHSRTDRGGGMNELALFAGAGGGLLGTAACGLRIVCAVELDWYCRCILVQRQNERAIPAFPIWDDVHTFDGSAWKGSVSIVTGGFPCQPFSRASRGRRVAVNLWPEMCRIVREVEPNYVFAENVSVRAIESAARDLCAMGYKADMLPLSAADLGADHTRERYWVLAYTDDKSELRRRINAEMAVCESVCEGIWEAAPNESRMADGVARRVERYRAIGNGQVPLVAAAALWSLANAD